MKKMRLSCVGLGARARYLLSLYAQHPDVELVAICDRFQRNIDLARREKGLEAPRAYLSYRAMMDETPADALLVAVDPDVQVNFACDAMERGVDVMTEVPAAYTLEQCWKLVDTVEKTGRLYQLNEQTRYMYFIRQWKQMYEAGEFGHILLMEGEYLHFETWDNYVDMNTGDFWYDQEGTRRPTLNGELSGAADAEKRLIPTWRYHTFKHPIYYLPHELSPLLSIVGDRVERVSCMGTRPGSYLDAENNAESRDLELAVMHTAKDTLLRIAAGFTTPHAHHQDSGCHWYHICGTKAEAEWARTQDDGSKLWTPEKGWQTHVWPFADPDAAEIARSSSHGGLDWYPIEAFVSAWADGATPPMDVYRAVETAAPAIVAAHSSEMGGVMLEVPNFRARYGRPDD